MPFSTQNVDKHHDSLGRFSLNLGCLFSGPSLEPVAQFRQQESPMLPAPLLNGMCRKTAFASKSLHSNRMEFQVCSSRMGIDERLRAYPHIFDVLFHHDGSPLGSQTSLERSCTRRQYDVRLQSLSFAFPSFALYSIYVRHHRTRQPYSFPPSALG